MRKKHVIPNFQPDGLLGLKEMPINSDVLGSYTGIPEGEEEVPVQDADDL